jgi:hypothetical protein
MSILFHHFKELKECMSEVKQLEGKVNISSKNKEELMIKKEEEKRMGRVGFEPTTPAMSRLLDGNKIIVIIL